MSSPSSRPPRASPFDPLVLTPSSSVVTCNDLKAANGADTFGGCGESSQGPSAKPGTTRSRTSSPRSILKHAPIASSSDENLDRHTPSLAPLVLGKRHVSLQPLVFGKDPDPDAPLPSIEQDTSDITSKRDTPSTTLYPPRSTVDDSVVGHPHANELTSSLQALRLQTPTELGYNPYKENQAIQLIQEEPIIPQSNIQDSSGGNTSTPSLQLTSTPFADVVSQDHLLLPQNHSDDIAEGLDALRLRSPSLSGSPARSQTPQDRSFTTSRRRRSNSTVYKEPYNVADEEPPEAFSHMREMQQVFDRARGMNEKIANILTRANLHHEPNSSIKTLYLEALRLSRFDLPLSRTVGLVGDTGVGKSSLINALLDKKDFARSSSNGSACTCVVTEYHYHDRDDYVVEAELFSEEDLRKQYKELLRMFQESKSPPEMLRNEELTDLHRMATIAEETFEASFKERLIETPGLLTSSIDQAVETMLQWASQLLPQHMSNQSTKSHETYSDIATCSTRIRELTTGIQKMETDGPRIPWPFVKRVRVYLSAYILSTGLVIADLPGLRDANMARQNITERYVLHCHQVFAVARIARGISDQSVQDVFQLARRAGLANVHIVCTKSDEIRAKEALNSYPGEREAVNIMQNTIEQAKQDIESLTELMEELDEIMDRTEEEEREYTKLLKDKRRSERIVKNDKFRLLQHLISVRNTDVSRMIKMQYKDHPVAKDLRVFCVSNKIYWTGRQESKAALKPHLELSGIVELRQYCIGVVAESHMRTITHYVAHEIPALLGSITLWVEAGSGNVSAENKWQILAAVDAIQAKVHEMVSPTSPLHTNARSLQFKFDRQVKQRMEQRIPQWSISARNASLEWHGFHQTSYAAWCRKFGEYQTKAQPYRCWNEEAMGRMANDMITTWSTFVGISKNHLNTLVGSLEDILQEAATLAFQAAQVQNESHSSLSALGATLRHRQDLLRYDIEYLIEDFQLDLSTLRTDALAPLRTAFIGQLMEETYRAANLIKGGESDQRRKNLITGRFGSQALFVSHKRMFRDAFRDVSISLEAAIRNAVTRRTAMIDNDLQLLRDENVVSESERNPVFRRELAEQVEQMKAELEEMSGILGV